MDGLMEFVARLKELRPVRAFQRYGAARGGLLAGGIAYTALFALAGALVIGLTAFAYILGGNKDLMDALVNQIGEMMPGLVKTAEDPSGLLDPASLVVENPVNLATIISLIVLLFSALSMMTSLRSSIQSMFGIVKVPRNPVTEKLADLSGFIVLAAGMLAGVALTAASQFFVEPILRWLNLPPDASTLALHLLAFLGAFAIDMAIFAFMFRIMAGARTLPKDLAIGSALGAAGAGIVRFLGTSAVGSIADNPLLAPFAAIVTLLLWVNLLSRITLLAAAFTANPTAPGKLAPEAIPHAYDKPNFVTYSAPETLEWKYDPLSGVVAVDDAPEAEAAPVPEWKGLRERLARRKVDKARERHAVATDQLAEAEADYAEGAWATWRKNTKATTARPEVIDEKIAERTEPRK